MPCCNRCSPRLRLESAAREAIAGELWGFKCCRRSQCLQWNLGAELLLASGIVSLWNLKRQKCDYECWILPI